MGITKSEKEKLKVLCDQLGIPISVINKQFTYWQNHRLIIRKAFKKWGELIRKEMYEFKLSSVFKKEFNKIMVPKVVKYTMDRFSEVVGILKNTSQKLKMR